MHQLKVGIIGGTGLDDPQILANKTEVAISTPFGDPSSKLSCGEINGVSCVVLSRHGKGHTIAPSQVNYRANISALKEVGCTHILATTACGSLQAKYNKGQLAVLDQFIDRTYRRESTFYDGKATSPKGVCHIPMAEPFCPQTRDVLIEAVAQLGYECHKTGTMVTIEGPRFSSKAESKWFHSMGADLINMTTVPEVCLAKEAAISYASVAMVTDYDSWKDDEDPVTVEQVMAILGSNADKAKNVVIKAIELLKQKDWSDLIESNQNVAKSATF